MTRSIAHWRHILLTLLLAAFIAPIAALAGSDLDCDDFANPDAAQVLLDADDSYEDTLDPDGDGLACNEDGDQADEPATLDHAARGAAYIDAVWDEVDRIGDSINHFIEVVNGLENATTDDELAEIRDVIIETSAMWVAYPETAPVFDPPADYEHIDELYQTWVTSVGESGEAWEIAWGLPAGTPDEAAAIDDFNEVIVATQEYEFELLDLLAEAEADLPLDDEANESDEDATGEDDGHDGEDEAAYLDDIESEIETLWDSFVRVDEIGDSLADVTDEDEFDSLAEEMNSITDMWSDYPQVAAGYEAPAGYAHIELAFLDLASTVAETGDLWEAFWAQESGTPDEAEAEEAFEESYLAAQEEIVDLRNLIADVRADDA